MATQNALKLGGGALAPNALDDEIGRPNLVAEPRAFFEAVSVAALLAVF